MATAFSSLRARLFALLGLALLLLPVPLALVSVKEAEKAAAEDLERAIFSRLFLLKEEGPKEEALLLELFRLSQTYGGGVGFVVRGEEVRFTELQDWPLPEPLLLALREGRPYQGVWRGVLHVALPEEGGGFGLAVPLEGVSGLGRWLLYRYATLGGGLFLLVFLLAYLALTWALRPLSRLEALLQARSPEDLSPLPEPPLSELKPVVEALNALLSRVS